MADQQVKQQSYSFLKLLKRLVHTTVDTTGLSFDVYLLVASRMAKIVLSIRDVRSALTARTVTDTQIHHGSSDLFTGTSNLLLEPTLSSYDFQSISPQSVA